MKFNSILICTFVCFLDSGEEIHLCFFLIIIHFHMIPNGKINTKLAVSYNTSCIISLEILEGKRDRDTMQVRLKPGSLETALTCLAYEHVPLRHFTKNLTLLLLCKQSCFLGEMQIVARHFEKRRVIN